jgi:(1->4)-alpha-D-glucan 1-alpha-D-glucosylmutase
MSAPRIPLSTYRLQFNRDFTFDDATALVPYLHALGVSHVYASPYLKARPGSTHGYDIIDHNALNPEIGTTDSFARFCRTLGEHGMGQILDFVPNHMGVGKADNAWWLDVLEWGEASPFAEFFDIDWTAARRSFPGKVLLPVLGDQYGAILEKGDLKLRFDVEYGGFSLWYFENRFPIRPRDYAGIIRWRLSEGGLPTPEPEAAARLEQIAGEFAVFSATKRSRIRRGAARARAERLKGELAALAGGDEAVRRLLEEAAELFNGTPGNPETFVRLHNLIERQFYRIAYWRTAADEINYRRFFEINDLAGIRPENPKVFAAIHRLLQRLIAEGCVNGVRLDHIDGLFDPAAYCAELEALARKIAPGATADAAPAAAGKSPRSQLFYIVVEKILARHERLRESWAVQGTSGYEFLNLVNGVLVDPAGEAALSRSYSHFLSRTPDFDEIVYEAKKHIIDTALASELAVLANQLDRLSGQDWRVRDFTRFRLRDALKEVVACFPVYRTYVSEAGATADDARDIDWAVNQAKKRWQAPDPEIFDFIRDVLLDRWQTPLDVPKRHEILRVAMRFQQYTGPVTAKSLEDTAFYRYHRLVSLNEVGGDPRQFGVSASAFHHVNEERAKQWPHAMLATATHDTKRGEDARARINVLSELAESWGERVTRWSRLNRSRRSEIDGRRAPSRNDEYLFYQVLLGVWPAEWTGKKPEPGPALEALKERLRGYVTKALREAKLRSSWARPNEAVEAASAAFLCDLIDSSRPNLFLEDFVPFQARIAFFGMLNSLVQTALKLACPGVPDIYRGCELWDLSLVDPDNRRPVDFAHAAKELTHVKSRLDWPRLMENWQSGAIKLALTHRLLSLRRAHPAVFTYGNYVPLQVHGAQADHVLAFVRAAEENVVVVTGRLFARLWGEDEVQYSGNRWADTWVELPEALGAPVDVVSGRRPALAGRRIAVDDLFRCAPVAVLAPT